MSADPNGKNFCAEYAKRGTAGCKKCKTKIEKGLLRIGKIVPNHFSDSGGDMKEWYHLDCIFDAFLRARATTKKIEESDDIEGFPDLQQDDRKLIMKKIDELQDHIASKGSPNKKVAAKTPAKPAKVKKEVKEEVDADDLESEATTVIDEGKSDESHKDNSFKEFRKICAKIYEESAYTGKTRILKEFLKNGTSGAGFKGCTFLWVKFLLPMVNKRIYNLQSKQLCKVFSRVFGGNFYEEMIEDLEKGDVAETIAEFHAKAPHCPPAKKTNLSIQAVDRYLDKLSELTREEDQAALLEKVARACTTNDLKMIIRLIKHDIRINAGPKHILDALNPAAYEAFQSSLNLEEVVRRSLQEDFGSGVLSVGVKLCTPVRPMLAEPCRSVEFAFKRCPKGMYSEVKYDGERVQLHKEGKVFQYYSRSLKPVVAHKVNHFKDFIPAAFPAGESMIIDGEILLVNTRTDEILPFGTLGVHKKAQFREASVCLYVFDCLFYNGQSLMDEPLKKRREILKSHMTEVKHHVMFSEMEIVKSPSALKGMIEDAINKGLEGLVLKDPNGKYEPGKRHWMKVKKDYLEGGSMADSADLVVLGAYFGTGNKGGIMSVFLMGCYDPRTKRWVTVTKVHTGHDDKTLERLQKELKMTKMSKTSPVAPKWLNCKPQLLPDFVATDPMKSQVWEITGAEFSKAEAHTANGISIRFPRVTRIRDDKEPADATNLVELENLYKTSKEQVLSLSESVVDELKIDESSSPEESPRQESESPIGKKKDSPVKRTKVKDEPQGSGSAANKKRKFERKPIPPCDLPDVFTDIVVDSLPKDFEFYKDLVRYFKAYGGTIDKNTFSHRIGTSKGTYRVEWIWESIKRRRLMDADPFKN